MTEVITTTNIGEQGQLTLPTEFREANHLHAGDPITLIQIGNQIILVPAEGTFTQISNFLSVKLEQAGITEEELQTGLDKIREEISRERYPELFIAE